VRNVCNPVLLKLAKSRVERLKEDVEPLLTQETMKTRESARKGLGFGFVGGGFWDSGFGILGLGFGKKSGFLSRIPCSGFRVPCFGFRVPSFGFQVSRFWFRVPRSVLQDSRSGFWGSG
jgi:hypothetical protein